MVSFAFISTNHRDDEFSKLTNGRSDGSQYWRPNAVRRLIKSKKEIGDEATRRLRR